MSVKDAPLHSNARLGSYSILVFGEATFGKGLVLSILSGSAFTLLRSLYNREIVWIWNGHSRVIPLLVRHKLRVDANRTDHRALSYLEEAASVRLDVSLANFSSSVARTLALLVCGR